MAGKAVEPTTAQGVVELTRALVQVVELKDLITAEESALRKAALEYLGRAHEESGTKSWDVKDEQGDKAGAVTLQFPAEKFEISDVAAALEWAQENAVQFVKVEVIPRQVIEERTITSFNEGPFLKKVTEKDGKVFFEGQEVDFVKHKPRGAKPSKVAVLQRDSEVVMRMLRSSSNPLAVVGAPIAEIADGEPEKMPWE